ncbi:hypothetical protein NL311_27975, partial [Klebsiella pneumoniae]|nr:hypothetical protein [Klebsiella pneumoniae]
GEVPSLQHEIGDDTMENGALVTEAFLASAQGTEVFTRLGSDVTSQLNNNFSQWGIVNSDVEEYSW